MNSAVSDEGEWCQINPATSNNANHLIDENTQDAEYILLYLIDMTIIFGDHVKWQKFIENVDFTKDPGPIRDRAIESNDEPSTSNHSNNEEFVDFTLILYNFLGIKVKLRMILTRLLKH